MTIYLRVKFRAFRVTFATKCAEVELRTGAWKEIDAIPGGVVARWSQWGISIYTGL